MFLIKNTSKFIGIISGFASIILWIVLNFYNPYTNSYGVEPVLSTFFMLLLPACVAIVASFTSKPSLLLIAFVWSLPFSLYLALTPGIFVLFGVSCMSYLISFFLIKLTKNYKLIGQ
ncbi:hypothetical protein [Piscibacillus salipiscarius]|uniref:Uncharacterized protein n=1 Tax=Piscibacillus salipiscarius TaxID=299480 RepID=A0ABW5QC08_9BACI